MIRRKTKSIVLSVPDMHIPFEHRDAFQFLKSVKEYFKPKKIECQGDISDDLIEIICDNVATFMVETFDLTPKRL